MTASEVPAERPKATPANRTAIAELIAGHRAPPGGLPAPVAFVRPFSVYTRSSFGVFRNPPIGVAYLTAMLEAAGYPVAVIDALGEAIAKETLSACGRYRLLGLTAEEIVARLPVETPIICVSIMYSQGWVFVRDLIQQLRRARPSARIVVGGEHVSALPEFILDTCPEVDFAVKGEGEVALLQLVHALTSGGDHRGINGLAYRGEDGRATLVGGGTRLANVDDLPRPAWQHFDLEAYFSTFIPRPGVLSERRMPVLANRGCPYECAFCSNANMWTRRYVMRDPAKVGQEVEDMVRDLGVDTIHLCDPTATVNRSWVLDFCGEIVRRGLRLRWDMPSGTRAETLDREVLEAMHRAGCRDLSYAPESGSVRSLKLVRKQVDLDKLLDSACTAVDVGFMVKMHFIFGFPGETRRDFLDTLLFSWRCAAKGIHDAYFNIFSPYPGSRFFNDLVACGRIKAIDDDYFRSLATYLDPSTTFSYCDGISGREMAIWRTVGFLSFYAISYLSAPRMIFRLLGGILRRRVVPQNILEARLIEVISLTLRSRR